MINEGKPTVNEATCTGCGVCRSVCPAPENAILLMPIFLRPAVEAKRHHMTDEQHQHSRRSLKRTGTVIKSTPCSPI